VISLHDEINERLELRVTDNLVGELRPELAAFLKHLGRAHLLEEVFVPLEATTQTKAAVAYGRPSLAGHGVGGGQ
jgi:hypothetical protein